MMKLAWTAIGTAWAVAGLDAAALVAAYRRWHPIQSAWALHSGVFQTPPPAVAAADEMFGLVWMTAFPVAVLMIVLAAIASGQLHAEGVARVVAWLTFAAGVLGICAGTMAGLYGGLILLS